MNVFVASLVVFITGLSVGSFLNVCILRVPRGQSVLWPGSSCPHCGTPIQWFDNVPLLNVVWLRARCRRCRGKISWRYPLVECANGLGYLGLAYQFGFSMKAAVYAWLLSALLVVAMIDFDHRMIPDVISLPGIVVGLVASTFVLPLGWVGSLVGMTLGGSVLWVLALLSPYLFGKEGMGGGDVKLLAMIGAFLGWQSVLMTLVLASMTGAVVGSSLMALRRMKRGEAMPFGPFLVGGAVVSMFFYQDVIDVYVALFW